MGTISGTNREQVQRAMQDRGDKSHHITYVGAENLPPDQCWAFVDCGDVMWFVVREQHTALELEEAWAAYRVIAADQPSTPNTASAAAAAAC